MAIFMNTKRKLKKYDYWIAEITLFCVSFLIFMGLLFRNDTKYYTNEDIWHVVLLLLWNLFLIFLCIQFPLDYCKKNGHWRLSLLFNGLSVLIWLATMANLVHYTFLSPYLREYTIVIFSIIPTSLLMVVVALCIFFKRQYKQ